MRLVDPSIELVVSGSSNRRMPTFGEWEQTVLGHTYDVVDYISLHAYYEEKDGDAASFLASGVDMDLFIEGVIATADAVRAKGKHSKHIGLSFDEWNVWYQTAREGDDLPATIQARGGWKEHPRIIEDEYNVTDAVVVGTLLNSLLRHGDRVAIANQAQLVNVIAPIRSEENGPAWRQSIFWPFARMSALAKGEILRLSTTSDRFDTAKFGDADVVDASATWDEETGRAAFFLANRGLDEPAEVTVTLRGLDTGRVTRAEVLRIPEGADRFTTNNEQNQDRVGLVALNDVTVDNGTLHLTLPALSWAVIEVQVTKA
jgi:alpha-N-arabinofuranosidase